MSESGTSQTPLALVRVNKNLTIRQHELAADHSCVIVDDFLCDPHQVVAFACRQYHEFALPRRSYPGMVRDVAALPMSEIYRFIRVQLSRRFGFFRSGINFSTLLSMTTLQPDELANLQRLCHTDPGAGSGRANFAALIYLFDNENMGGTGFYRWKAQTLIERATALEMDHPDKALAFLSERFATYRRPPCYMTRSNEIAELIHMIPARFNRLIFYPGNVPHSAFIESPRLLSMDPAMGRLTLNCFASVKPTLSA